MTTGADIPDAPPAEGTDLLTLERELIRSVDAYSDTPTSEEEGDRWSDYNFALADRIAETPARSYSDVAVKLRCIKREHEEGPDNPCVEPLVDTALEALERLGAT